MELETRIDEDIRIAFPWFNPSAAGCAFDQAQGSGAYGYHPSPGVLRGAYFLCGLLANAPPFGVHLVRGHVLDLDRQECPCPDMQGDMGYADTARDQRLQQVLVEMQ